MNARALAVLAVLVAGCRGVTEVVVQVDADGLAIPAQIDRVRIVVGTQNGADLASENITYESQLITLCGTAPQSGCQSLPLSVTLVPGPHDGSALVRVEVQSFAPGQQTPTTTDASEFSFVSGTRQQLRFVLRESCLGMDCALQNAVCSAGGVCTKVSPTNSTAPDMQMSTSIERVAFASGSLPTVGGAATTTAVEAAVPAVEEGDLMIAAIDVSATSAPMTTNFIVPLPPPWIMLNTHTEIGETFAIAYAFATGTPADSSLYLGVTPAQAQPGIANWMFTAYRGVSAVNMPYLMQTKNSPNYMIPAQAVPAGGGYLAIISNSGYECVPMNTADSQLRIAGAWTLIEALSAMGEEGENVVLCEGDGDTGVLQTSLVLVLSPL
jgi:hypothetical protein